MVQSENSVGNQNTQQQEQSQQQWMMMMGMQYPASAMAMMHHHQQQKQMMMMYPQHYMQYPYNYHHHHQLHYQQMHPWQYQQQQQQQQQRFHQMKRHGSSEEDVKTIWIGDLHHWMDEAYLNSCFARTGEVEGVKVIRNKHTGQSEGYGFVEFFSRATAEKVLESYSNSLMPNTEQPFRLNWATFSSGDKRMDNGSDLSIFVGDLASDVTDAMLLETFSSKYTSVKGAKVVIDSNTGHSRGYGFVRFGDENERSKAITEMNGSNLSSRPMRIGVATPKKAAAYQQQHSSQSLAVANGHTLNGPQYNSGNNTTIFVGGLDMDASEEDLRGPFSQFGEVISVKIPVGKGCGFVKFLERKNAEDAMENLNGTVIANQTVRLSWGRSTGNKQRFNHGNQWNGGNQGENGFAVPQNEDSGANAATPAVNGTS